MKAFLGALFQPAAAEPRYTRSFLTDVEQLAEAAVETAEELHELGLGRLAQRLEHALARLGGR